MKTIDRIINITQSTRVRVKKMLTTLFPDVSYVRVAHSGIITLKKHWYSFKKEKILITDLIIKTIPEKIADEAEKKGKGIGYRVVFNDTISAMFQLMNMRRHWDILDYVWEQFNLYCNNIQDISISEQSSLEYSYNSNITLSFISKRSIYGITTLFRQKMKTKKENTSTWLDDMKSHLTNLPIRINRIFPIKQIA